MKKGNFFQRIRYAGKLDDISAVIIQDFGLGEFVSNKLVEVGYEDFNYILETTKSKHFVKIFSVDRSDSDCQRCVDVILAAMKKGVATPKLIMSRQGYLHKIKIGNVKLRLCVMKYVNGIDFFRLRQKPDVNGVKFLARQVALINTIRLRPKFVNDEWAIPNFLKEFKKKGKFLDQRDFETVAPLVEKFKKTNISKLPHCFVHGDILTTNTIKDHNGKIWIVDFSVSNYYPRIQEIAVMACDILFHDKDMARSQKDLETVLKEYQKKIRLTKKELKALPLYIKLAHAMHVLLANYQKVMKKNNSKENECFLKKGRNGLRQMM